MYLLDWSVDTLYRARLLSYYRGSPGDTDMLYMTPVVFNIATGEETKMDALRNVNAASLDWTKQPGQLIIEDRPRGYQQINLYLYNCASKKQELLYKERSNTNIDNFRYFQTDDPSILLFTSEKDGWKQLYQLQLNNRTVLPVTNGQYYVNDLLHYDAKTKTIVFTASGKEAGRNPYLQHAYSINIDGKNLRLLTPEDLNHDISISPDGKWITDNMSSWNQPTRSVLRDTKTGRVAADLTHADVQELEKMKLPYPEAFTTIGRDGTTTLYGAIWKPSHFDASKKYPVIDQTYTGPHTFMFPRNFLAALGRSNQALAELGFIVIAVDGMGTANRSKAFHNVSYKNMGNNLLDHVLAIKDLGKRFTWIDTTRVGIFGHSAGGYDAGHAVLAFPDFYKVAVASSGDHDFRMEKDWWPEMYMGWPVDSSYNEVSNISMAKNLKGKLLIVHGGIDENVNPSATFKLAEALVKADKEFDMLILPSQHHGYTGLYNDYFTKRKWNYFVQHLLGAIPIWDFTLR
jgi:dipeptidyl aminopeptidase/acylaminoacyl peptidase